MGVYLMALISLSLAFAFTGGFQVNHNEVLFNVFNAYLSDQPTVSAPLSTFALLLFVKLTLLLWITAVAVNHAKGKGPQSDPFESGVSVIVAVSTIEELIFRLFIPTFFGMLIGTPTAVILSGSVWAFIHIFNHKWNDGLLTPFCQIVYLAMLMVSHLIYTFAFSQGLLWAIGLHVLYNVTLMAVSASATSARAQTEWKPHNG